MYIYICVYIYMYIYTVHIYIYMSIYIGSSVSQIRGTPSGFSMIPIMLGAYIGVPVFAETTIYICAHVCLHLETYI